MAIMTNVKKTIYYFQRNGLKKTCLAAFERLQAESEKAYEFVPVSEEVMKRQRDEIMSKQTEKLPLFSILVPAYRTKEEYLCQLIDSLLTQSYPVWELVLADATEDESVKNVALSYGEDRIRYVKLAQNGGISENTNQGLLHVTGDYVGLLDHDDILTPDALYEMYQAIRRGQRDDLEIQMIYSDEDKCDGDAVKFFEPHIKEDFNLDLLLSNNYICHFLMLKRELIQELGFRKEFDGAQDYDLVLRSTRAILQQENGARLIGHVPKVLYHWRCHQASTAENPKSKTYAYEAGKKALESYLKEKHISATVENLPHVGFYRIDYRGRYFEWRKDLGAVGGRVLKKGKLAGGRMDADGQVYYEYLRDGYSGPMHRAVLTQDALAVDLRCMLLSKDCEELFLQVTGVAYRVDDSTGVADIKAFPEDTDFKGLSLKLCEAVRDKGYMIMWDPEICVKY